MAELVLRYKGENLQKDLKELESLNQNAQEEESKRPPLESFFYQNTDENLKNDENLLNTKESYTNEIPLNQVNESPLNDKALNQVNQSYENEIPFYTGIKKLDEKINNNGLSLYDLYALKRLGIEINRPINANLKGDFAIKKLSGDKEFETIKATNNAFDNLNSIIENAPDTAGMWNQFARGYSKLTNHTLFSADEDNQKRLSDEAMLKSNYLAAIPLRSGGTQEERDAFREAINFGGLNAKDTTKKAFNLYNHLMQRQQAAIETLKAKGYNETMIKEALGLEGGKNFENNIKAYEYLKNNLEDFDSEEFKESFKYQNYFNQRK